MENSTKVLIGVGVLAGAYLIFKNKISISTGNAAAAPTVAAAQSSFGSPTLQSALPSGVSASGQPVVYFGQLPVQDPFFNANPSIQSPAPITAQVYEPNLSVGSMPTSSATTATSGNPNCMTITFNATQGGGYASWLDCQGYPREQYLNPTQTITVCAMNGTAKGIPYSVNGQC